MKKLFFFVLSIFSCYASSGQTIVKDILPGFTSSFAGILGATNQYLFFDCFSTGWYGDLYVTDGTEQGTHWVKSFAPGGFSWDFPRCGIVLNDVIYFVGKDSVNGAELWRSDGTTAGTFMVKNINPGPYDGAKEFYQTPVVMNGKIYFIGSASASGNELWKTDGTTTGTTMVKDIHTGTSGGCDFTEHFTVMGNKIYFAADNGSHALELWVSDGTSTGTKMVSDINSGGVSSDPFQLTPLGSLLIFEAESGNTGREIFKSDGTQTGTSLLKDIFINPGSSSYPYAITACGNNCFFYADNFSNGKELWKTDGTSNGTSLVKDLWPGITGSQCSSYSLMHPDLISLNDSILIFDACIDTFGDELLRSDGTASGSWLVKDINPGLNAGADVCHPVLVDGRIYFFATDDLGTNIWQTDGTATGTIRLTDLSSLGVSLFNPNNFLYYWNNSLYFEGTDSAHGSELWKYDLPVGINDPLHFFQNEVDVFPDPATDIVTVKFHSASEKIQGQLFTLTGTVVNQFIPDAGDFFNLDLSALANGIYFMQLKCKSGMVVKKIIVQH